MDKSYTHAHYEVLHQKRSRRVDLQSTILVFIIIFRRLIIYIQILSTYRNHVPLRKEKEKARNRLDYV